MLLDFAVLILHVRELDEKKRKLLGYLYFIAYILFKRNPNTKITLPGI